MLGSFSYSGRHDGACDLRPSAAVTLRVSRQSAGNRRYRTPAELGADTGEPQGARLAAIGISHPCVLVGSRAARQHGGSVGQRENGVGGVDPRGVSPVSYTHLRAHETVLDLVCRLLLEKKKK